MIVRDSQRSKLYKAERSLLTAVYKFESLDEIRSYIIKIGSDPWVLNQYKGMVGANLDVIVGDGRGRRSACFSWLGDYAYFSFPRWGRIEPVVLHEVAHWIINREAEWRRVRYASHGPEFANVFSRLIYRKMGEESFRVLTNSFRDHGVRYLWLQ